MNSIILLMAHYWIIFLPIRAVFQMSERAKKEEMKEKNMTSTQIFVQAVKFN